MLLRQFKTKHLSYIVASCIAGITSVHYLIPGLALLAIIAGVSLLETSHKLAILVITCCFFFIGSTRYHQYRAAYFDHNECLNKNCSIIATVQEVLPRFENNEPICILLHISHVFIGQKQYTLHKKIYLFLPFYTKLWIKPHQTIEIKNIILKHPNSASYQEYLIRENIWAIAHPKSFTYTTCKKPSVFMQYIETLNSMPLHITDHAISQLTHSLYLSIFCGKKIKSPTTTKLKELFSYWGLSHHLARSGLHLIILMSLLLFLLSCIPCSSLFKQRISVLLLLCYYMMTYSSVAFMRAFYMYLIYTLCKQLRVPTHAIHILLITTLLTLMLNPCHLFFLDFQLSFSITFLILWFSQMTKNRKTIAL
jgi:ComEC/Rec2-related protein